MSTGAWIIIAILALVVGMVLGFFIARKYIMNYFQENPPISEEMIRVMFKQMGQKPSEKRIQQIVHSMRAVNKK